MSYSGWDQTSEYASQSPFSFICILKAEGKKELFGDYVDFWISDGLFSAVSECVQEGEKWAEKKLRAL